MITNWDIVSRIDPKTQSRLYTLMTDGTEHDARLIAKKLAGYAKEPTPAVAPFVYAFELPSDLDEDTLDKIRTATREGVEQTNKVNQFVPGGILGDPLFNADTSKEDKAFPTFITLDPSESFFSTNNTPSAPKAPNSLELEEAPAAPIAPHVVHLDDNLKASAEEVTTPETPAAPQNTEPSAAPSAENTLKIEQKTLETPSLTPQEDTLPINDKDMLIKDMEGTMLDKMPLEDIFSAETKYDMFLDLENQKLVKNSQVQREQKMNALADGKDSLEESFNVFEQKIKDQTSIIDLEDLNEVAGGLAPKDKSFAAHATVEPTSTAQAEQPQETAAEPQAAQEPAVPATPSAEPHKPQPKADSLDIPDLIAVRRPASQPENPQPVSAETPAPDAEDPFAKIEKTIRFTTEDATEKTPFSLGPSPEDASVMNLQEDHAPGEMPEEVVLGNTIAPGSMPTAHEDEPDDDLPAITLRGKKIDALEKTFNLETTLNTEIMKRQYEKSFHDLNKPSEAKPMPVAPAPQVPLAAPAAPAVQPAAPTAPAAQEPNEKKENLQDVLRGLTMDENIEPKTTFRIRRKADTIPPTAPVVHPAAPAPVAPAPHAPVAPAPSVPQQPVTPASVAPAPVQRTPMAANPRIEKTKTIDHSIELPLSELKKHNWPLEVPLVPIYTLENMVMSVNRFAHATAISVIENPGKLYNPLVLHGATGTGKTHFLNAMAYAFSKKYGQENIFMTNGVRLSRGIQRYVMEGNIEKFEKFMDSVKVLLIDDIHLLAINEQNRVHISNLLNKFLREQRQIVITSKYPPESLEKLEELIRFKLDSGWISELKPASGNTHFKIVKKMLLDNGVDLNDTQITEFFGGPHMTLGTITRSIRRLKVLENLIYPNIPESERSQATIFEKLLATAGEDASSEILSRDPESITTITPVGNGEWGRIGFFYPQNSSHMMNWMVYALQQRAKELGIAGGFEIAVRSSYATENIISSAFKIANLCDNKKLKGAVILGPALTSCEPSVRENFYDILTHMLEIMLIRCGIINSEDAKAPSTYVKVISELLR